MRTRFVPLLSALLTVLLLTLPALAEVGNYVLDVAGLLDMDQWGRLEERAAALSQAHACGIYIITLDDYTRYGYGDIEDVAASVFQEEDLGLGSNREGLLLLMSMEERDYALYAHGVTAGPLLNRAGLRQLEEGFLGSFREDDWYNGFSGYLTACGELLDQAERGETPRELPLPYIAGSVAGAFLIALIVCLVLKGQMRSVRRQAQARSYVLGNGVHLTNQYDRYTHTTETRRTIETRSSGGGGGGGVRSSGGSGKF